MSRVKPPREPRQEENLKLSRRFDSSDSCLGDSEKSDSDSDEGEEGEPEVKVSRKQCAKTRHSLAEDQLENNRKGELEMKQQEVENMRGIISQMEDESISEIEGIKEEESSKPNPVNDIDGFISCMDRAKSIGLALLSNRADSSFLTGNQTQSPSTQDESRALSSMSDHSPEQLVAKLGWYQEQLAQYQQACHDWTVWKEEKTREVSELNEQLSLQTEAFRIKAAEAEKLHEREEAEKRTDQSLMKLKELEIAELRESLDRLEKERSELEEELTEMRNTVAVSETVENNNALTCESKSLLDLVGDGGEGAGGGVLTGGQIN